VSSPERTLPDMTAELWILLGGAVLGYFVGRNRAETGRARHEARKQLAGRKGYRRR